MQITMLKSKIHRATVTEAQLNYVGSITIDKKIMEESGITEYEKVQVVDINNGNRLETYVIEGEENSGVMCLNGAAARYVQVGDKIIVMTYCTMDKDEISDYKPTVVFVDDSNKILEIKHYEKHGETK